MDGCVDWGCGICGHKMSKCSKQVEMVDISHDLLCLKNGFLGFLLRLITTFFTFLGDLLLGDPYPVSRGAELNASSRIADWLGAESKLTLGAVLELVP